MQFIRLQDLVRLVEFTLKRQIAQVWWKMTLMHFLFFPNGWKYHLERSKSKTMDAVNSQNQFNDSRKCENISNLNIFIPYYTFNKGNLRPFYVKV